ncbi:hypothetical protein HWV62_25458 [Athelia sp. TMB]|nr:hypothetical protein HWV62_25458 [Athelia sp. TMB]
MMAIGRHFILDPDSADSLPYKVTGLRASEGTTVYEVLIAGSYHAEDLEQHPDVTVKISGTFRSLTSVELLNPPCEDVQYQTVEKKLRIGLPSLPELPDAQPLIVRVHYRRLMVSRSRDVSITATELVINSDKFITFEDIAVKVGIETAESSQPRESGNAETSLQPTTEKLFAECPRILVIGRSGAGKSTLINKAFRVKDDEGQAAESKVEAGISNINQEITCQANPQFVLHDSQGFEGGETENLQTVETFLLGRGEHVDISQQVHAVWLCLPIPSAGGRIFETGIEKFLKMKINRKLGKIPVIAVFTKYDTLLTRVQRLQTPDPAAAAKKILNETCITPFKKYEKSGIPHMTVSTAKRHEKTLQALIELTTEQVSEHLPEVASIVLGVAQQISPKVKIDSSIAVGKRALAQPGDANKALITGMGGAFGLITSPAAPVLVPTTVVLVLAKWGYDIYQQIPDILMRLMAYVVNLILVIQLLFLALAGGRCELDSALIKTVVTLYKDSNAKSEIHESIRRYATGSLSIWNGRDQAFEIVSGLIKQYYDCPEIRDLKDKIIVAHGLPELPNTSRTHSSLMISG